jgi:hypothetical protein
MILMGIDPTRVYVSGTDVPEFSQGQLGATSDGNIYMFYQASSAFSAVGMPGLMGASGATPASTTNTAPGTGQGRRIGFCAAELGSGDYGWFLVFGEGAVRVLASAAASTQLNSTGTAGAMDDDATAGAEVINGVALQSANGGATGAVLAWVTWPTVGRTL